MTGDALRFLHASDFRLGEPMRGLRYIPEIWRNRLRDAPYAATASVFDTALDEEVDFVVLTGDLIDLRGCSPYAINFLLEQFEKLDQAGTPIYWISGELDQHRYWSKAIKFPENVQLFGANGVESCTGSSPGIFQYSIVGSSFDGKRTTNTSAYAGFGGPSQTTIALCYGDVEISDDKSNIAYWACGGLEDKLQVESGTVELNYPGSPQPRTSNVSSAGCTLLSVSDENVVVANDVPVAGIRWSTVTVQVGTEDSLVDVQERCLSAISEDLSNYPAHPVLFTVQLKVDAGHWLIGPRQFTTAGLANQLIQIVGDALSDAMIADVTVESPMETLSPGFAYDGVAKDFSEMTEKIWSDGWGQMDLSDKLPHGMPIDMRLVREDIDGMHTIKTAATFGVNTLDAKSNSPESEDRAA